MLLKGKLSHDETGRDAALPRGGSPPVGIQQQCRKAHVRFFSGFHLRDIPACHIAPDPSFS